MAKQSKRSRKFQASGGIKGRLEKGTVRSKGKLKKRKRNDDDEDKAVKKPITEKPKFDESEDLVSAKNLGGLDLDTFFEKISESLERGEQDFENETEEKEEDTSSEEEKSEASDNEESKSEDDASETGSDSESDEDVQVAEARLKKQMSKMKDQDPDFYKYLKENEESLLEFGQDSDSESDSDGDDDEVEGIDDDEEEEAIEATKSKRGSSEPVVLTGKVLKSLEQGVFKSHGIKTLKKLVGAYRTACHMADSSEEEKRPRPGESGVDYTIDSPQIFDALMMMCLDRLSDEFKYHLFQDGTTQNEEEAEDGDSPLSEKPINPKRFEKSKTWGEMKPILNSFFRSTLHLMEQSKEAELLTFILKSLAKYIPLLSAFDRVAESMLKSLTSLWSAPLDTAEDYQVVRLNAFLRIRQLALTQPFPFIEQCLKKTYLAYARRARFGGGAGLSTSLPTLTFMGNCLVELYSLDYHSSYQHAFVYIRQLALYLRAALQKKTEESFQQVYCWQYMNCLKLWTAVLSSAASQADGESMRSLIYPLTEIINGTCRHVPSPVRHLPLRLQCVRLLQQLAAASGTFIPTTWILLESLGYKEWIQKPMKTKTGTTIRGIQMNLMLKFPKDDVLRTHEQLEAAMNEMVILIEREIDLYRYSVGFPEFSIRIRECLKRFSSQTRNSRWRAFMRGCIDMIDDYSRKAVLARAKLDDAPKDIKQLECLLPPSGKTMRERLEDSVSKEAKSQDVGKQPQVSEKVASDADGSSTPKAKKKKSKNQKKEKAVFVEDAGVLNEEDEVQEGVDWLDED